MKVTKDRRKSEPKVLPFPTETANDPKSITSGYLMVSPKMLLVCLGFCLSVGVVVFLLVVSVVCFWWHFFHDEIESI